jgi:hypothetical protein
MTTALRSHPVIEDLIHPTPAVVSIEKLIILAFSGVSSILKIVSRATRVTQLSGGYIALRARKPLYLANGPTEANILSQKK